MIAKIKISENIKDTIKQIKKLLKKNKGDYMMINIIEKSKLKYLPDIQDFLNYVVEVSGFSLEQLREKKRLRKLVDWRVAIYYVLRFYYGYSHYRIGKLFNRDHASVLTQIKYNWHLPTIQYNINLLLRFINDYQKENNIKIELL